MVFGEGELWYTQELILPTFLTLPPGFLDGLERPLYATMSTEGVEIIAFGL